MSALQSQSAVRPAEVGATPRGDGALSRTPHPNPSGGEPVGPRRWERAAHLAVGIAFGGAAIGNLIGFLPRATELLPWFADTAWLPSYSWLLHHLVPAAPLVVTLGAAFEATVAVLLLTRRHVPVALGLAAAWTIGLIPAIGWPYWTLNLVFAAALTLLYVRARRSRHHTLLAQEQR